MIFLCGKFIFLINIFFYSECNCNEDGASNGDSDIEDDTYNGNGDIISFIKFCK